VPIISDGVSSINNTISSALDPGPPPIPFARRKNILGGGSAVKPKITLRPNPFSSARDNVMVVAPGFNNKIRGIQANSEINNIETAMSGFVSEANIQMPPQTQPKPPSQVQTNIAFFNSNKGTLSEARNTQIIPAPSSSSNSNTPAFVNDFVPQTGRFNLGKAKKIVWVNNEVEMADYTPGMASRTPSPSTVSFNTSDYLDDSDIPMAPSRTSSSSGGNYSVGLFDDFDSKWDILNDIHSPEPPPPPPPGPPPYTKRHIPFPPPGPPPGPRTPELFSPDEWDGIPWSSRSSSSAFNPFDEDVPSRAPAPPLPLDNGLNWFATHEPPSPVGNSFFDKVKSWWSKRSPFNFGNLSNNIIFDDSDIADISNNISYDHSNTPAPDNSQTNASLPSPESLLNRLFPQNIVNGTNSGPPAASPVVPAAESPAASPVATPAASPQQPNLLHNVIPGVSEGIGQDITNRIKAPVTNFFTENAYGRFMLGLGMFGSMEMTGQSDSDNRQRALMGNLLYLMR
jgi:hypothetical protein